MSVRIIKPKIVFPRNAALQEFEDVLNQSIISVRTNNSINNLVGGGEIHLVPNPSELRLSERAVKDFLHKFYQTIDTMDKLRVTIEDVDGDTNKDWLCTGFVDNVFRTEQRMNQQTSRGVMIRFSNLVGKAITKDEITFLPEYMVNDIEIQNFFGKSRIHFFAGGAGIGLTKDGQNVFIGHTITDAIKYIIESVVSKFGENILTIRSDSYSNAADEVNKINLSQFTGGVAELLMSVVDRQFYEVFTDTVGTEACLVFRPKPFESKSWNDLRTHELEWDEVISDSTGFSDYEVKNLFRCYSEYDIFGSNNDSFHMIANMFPLLDLNSIKKYGLRQLDGKSTTISFRDELNKLPKSGAAPTTGQAGKAEQTPTVDNCEDSRSAIVRKRNKLFRWYAYPYYESGNMTFRGRQSVRAGERIYCGHKISREGSNYGMVYYVTDVSQSYSVFQPFTTQVSLTRGQEQTGREVYEYLTEKTMLRGASTGNVMEEEE